jgi:hypothetical protein
MTKVKKFFIIAIIIAIAILVGWLIVSEVIKRETPPETKEPAIAEEIYGLSGEIREIKDKTLLVEAKILLANPEEGPIKETLKIVVANETKILKLEFPEEIPEDSTEIFPEKTEINFDNLKIGDRIDIETIDNVSGKIKDKIEIVASIINVVE